MYGRNQDGHLSWLSSKLQMGIHAYCCFHRLRLSERWPITALLSNKETRLYVGHYLVSSTGDAG